MNRAIGQYRYHEAAQALWHFFWHEFCDWYVELKKLRFRENSGLNADWRNILAAFETALRLLHPAMPFLTEELWQRLAKGAAGRPVSIALAGFPRYRRELTDYEAEREIGIVQELVTMARTLRAESKLDPKQQLRGVLYARAEALEVAERARGGHPKTGQRQARVSGRSRRRRGRGHALHGAVRPGSGAAPGAAGGATKTPGKGPRPAREEHRQSKRQLSDEIFLGKAPAQVVESIRRKLVEYEEQLRKIEEALVGAA